VGLNQLYYRSYDSYRVTLAVSETRNTGTRNIETLKCGTPEHLN
jgi:hypothetical protein